MTDLQRVGLLMAGISIGTFVAPTIARLCKRSLSMGEVLLLYYVTVACGMAATIIGILT